MTEQRNAFVYWTVGILLVCLTTWIRYWFVASGQLNLAPDEAQYWDWSRTLQWSYYSKGPLIAFINRLGTMAFGPTELGVRSGAIVGSAIMQLAVLGWVGGFMGRIRTAFWTLVILNTTLLFMAGGLLMTTDNPLLVCWILGMVCLHVAMEKNSLPAFVVLGLCLALGIMAKYTMLLFLPLAVVASLWIGRTHTLGEGYWPRLLKALGIGGLLGVLPIVVWNATHGWVGIKHVLYRGAMAGDKAQVFFRVDKFPEYLASQIGVLTPWWFLFLILGAWAVVRRLLARNGHGEAYGLDRKVGIILTVFFWPVWLFFLFWSLHTKVEANWSATAYPAGILLAALAVEAFMRREPRSRWRWTWPTLGAAVFLLLHMVAFIPVDSPKNPVHRLLGWADLGQQVHHASTEMGDPDTIFVFGTEYGFTAELSFYVPGQRRAYCLAGGRKMNQYDLWPGPGPEYTGAILVAKGEKGEVSERVRELFESVDGPRIVTTRHGLRLGQTFTLFLCRGYKGIWPAQEGSTF